MSRKSRHGGVSAAVPPPSSTVTIPRIRPTMKGAVGETWREGGCLPSRELTYPPDNKAYLKMIFLFPRWDMLIPWRVTLSHKINGSGKLP